jgi:hypothetical protein
VWAARRSSCCSTPRATRNSAADISDNFEETTVYTYKVIEVREKMLGGKMSGDKLERLLNEQARQGWQLRAITSADIKGRLGPGGVEGLLVTFERKD